MLRELMGENDIDSLAFRDYTNVEIDAWFPHGEC